MGIRFGVRNCDVTNSDHKCDLLHSFLLAGLKIILLLMNEPAIILPTVNYIISIYNVIPNLENQKIPFPKY